MVYVLGKIYARAFVQGIDMWVVEGLPRSVGGKNKGLQRGLSI